MTFSELNDSSGSFSYIIPSSDQDMDDVTLGKLLTEAHRGQADYCEPEGVSVSQSSSSSVVFDESGKPDGERMVDQSVGFGLSVIPTSSDAWRDVATVFRIAEPQRRAAKHLGHTWYIGKRFCRSTCIFISSLSSRIESMGDWNDKESRFSLTVKQRFENTNSRLIMTEEVYKS